jgi:exodeoxyribonuclease VII small subunit
MSPDTGKTPTFEQSLNELEEIVRALEAGDVSLEESLAKYEAGVSLLKHCYTQLRQAEQRVLLLAGEDADGKPIVQPFEPPATAEAPALGSRRKSRRADSEY